MDYGILTLLSIVIVIVLALLTKRTLEPLIAGTVVAYMIISGWSFPTAWMEAFFDVASNRDHQWVFMVCALFGSLIALLQGGEEFVRKVLVEHLKCRKVVCGTDFRFGERAACGAEDMKRLCAEFGMECAVIEKLYDGGEAISSTRIREAAAKGDMQTVERLCGYPFCIENTVVAGEHLGREYGLPTINQGFGGGYVIPKYGVYVSAAYVDGKFYPAVTNVGVKPTVSDEKKPGAETNIIGA